MTPARMLALISIVLSIVLACLLLLLRAGLRKHAKSYVARQGRASRAATVEPRVRRASRLPPGRSWTRTQD